MPYAQEHYPYENKEKFESNFPAQFIAEGLDQTRGWFYTLIVLSTALFKKTSFENVIVNGIVLAEDGQKMSKRLNNYPDPAELFENYSIDAMRYYLLSSPVLLAENLNFSEQGVLEILRRVEMLLWNVYRFYSMYADQKSKIKMQKSKIESKNILDLWIMTRLNQVIKNTTEQMDIYNIPKAIRPFTEFINDLSTWYLRRSRERFKSGDEKDKQSALETTGFVLLELSKVIAPFMPFIAEQLWQKVSGHDFKDENKSVHLEKWPSYAKASEGKPSSTETKDYDRVLEDMEATRKIVELGLAGRDEAGIRVRQPLADLYVKEKKLGKEFIELIKDELNVKQVHFDHKYDLQIKWNTEITPELEQEGVKREMVRFINALRKNAGLTIKDNILVFWETENKKIKEAILKHAPEIMKDTLASEMDEGKSENTDITKEANINGSKVWLGVKKK